MSDYSNLPQILRGIFTQAPNRIMKNSFAAYRDMGGLNASVLKEPTPKEMLHAMLGGNETSHALALGDAGHKAILEPELFDGAGVEEYFQYSPTKGLDTKAARDAFAADPSRPLVTPEIIDDARRIRDAVYAHSFAKQLIQCPGDTEVSLQAWEPLELGSGYMRKARFDKLPGPGAGFVVDVKTFRKSLTTRAIRSEIVTRGYHIQARYYLDVLRMVTGEDRGQFYFIFVTNEAPFMCRVAELNIHTPGDNLLNDAASLLYGGEYGAGRLPMWLNASGEFLRRIEEQHADPIGAWEGYEGEEAVIIA
jgi:hypothetical protein